MPLYAFVCDKCKLEKEELNKESLLCPNCGAEMRRKFSTFMVKVKGGGGFPSRRKDAFGTAPYSSG